MKLVDIKASQELPLVKFDWDIRGSTLCFALLVPLLLILNIRIKMPARIMTDFAAIKFGFKQVASKSVESSQAGFTRMD